MTKPAHQILEKIDPVFGGHRRKVRASAEKCISDLLSHLNWLKCRHIKKEYSDEYLISTCFKKPKALKNNAEINAYCRAHLTVSIKELENLVKIMRGDASRVSCSNLRRYKEIVQDYLGGRKSYGVHSWEVFRISRQLAIQSAYRKQSFHIDHKTGQIASIFMLRQALEAKFERLVAVNIYNSSQQTPKLRHGFHYEFINNNPTYFEFKSVKFSFLKKIYDWCNVIVHRAFQPYAWQIAYAHSICSGLFVAGDLNENGGWSINGGVRIQSLSEMQTAFINHFCSSYDHGIWCMEAGKPEAGIGTNTGSK